VVVLVRVVGVVTVGVMVVKVCGGDGCSTSGRVLGVGLVGKKNGSSGTIPKNGSSGTIPCTTLPLQKAAKVARLITTLLLEGPGPTNPGCSVGGLSLDLLELPLVVFPDGSRLSRPSPKTRMRKPTQITDSPWTIRDNLLLGIFTLHHLVRTLDGHYLCASHTHRRRTAFVL
jgi:hypothetical protein